MLYTFYHKKKKVKKYLLGPLSQVLCLALHWLFLFIFSFSSLLQIPSRKRTQAKACDLSTLEG